jgi:NTP pyrophosphatase (non-canonical NTP hydrolase)
MRTFAVTVAYEWAIRAFGADHVSDVRVRALRAAEEVVELAQSVGVERDLVHRLVDTVYGRPPGEPPQELGGSLLTLVVLARVLDEDPEELFEREVLRVLGKSPEHFARRNQEKLGLGLVGDSGQ